MRVERFTFGGTMIGFAETVADQEESRETAVILKRGLEIHSLVAVQ